MGLGVGSLELGSLYIREVIKCIDLVMEFGRDGVCLCFGLGIG